MAPRAQPSEEGEASASLRRIESTDSFIAPMPDGPVKDYRDYRVRKSSLIA